MSDITVKHKQHDGTVINTFRPENLAFTLNKGENGPHDISYELSRAQVSPDMIGPYRTDFELIDNSTFGPVTIMSGLHTMYSMASNEEHVKIAGKGWLHYFERRFWPFDGSDPNLWARKVGTLSVATLGDPPTDFAYYTQTPVDSMVVMKDLLNVLQLFDPVNTLDYTYSLANIGHTIDTFGVSNLDTENILSKFQFLAQQDPGMFDFWMDNNKVMRRAAPHRYNVNVWNTPSLAEKVFDSTDTNTDGVFYVSFTNTGPDATRVLGYGQSQSSTLASVKQYNPASATYRLLESEASFDNIIDRNQVIGLTRNKLLFGVNPVHEIEVTVVPEAITNFWTRFQPGVAIWVTADLEGHTIDSAQEIVSIDGTSDNQGNLTAAFKLNQIYQYHAES
jgi:hypothetical protein